MNYIYNKPITEIISQRHSVRSYKNSDLPKEIIEKIKQYIDEVNNPFGKKVKIKIIQKDTSNKELKLGTYGVIKGANYFLGASCSNDELSLIALGYTLEKVILYCTSLGLGTVWLGGTFNKGGFAKAMELREDEILPIVSPFGYESDKKSFLASLMGNNNNKRKKYSEVFFDGNFDTPLSSIASGPYFEMLEMVRIAPSAVNKQPWRVLKDNENFHFYLSNSKSLNKVDIGIALCHFHLTAIEKELHGEFKILENLKNNKDNNFEYIATWISK